MTITSNTARDAVAAGALAAAHRRDHQHDTDRCTPHCVEVVHLGRRAVMVCHDCRSDSGFLPTPLAESLARAHTAAPRS